jgi:uncharacterized protein (TIGR02466 family)
MKNKEIKKTILFGADIFHSNVGNLEQRQELIDEILNIKNKFIDGNDRSNAGCWRKDDPCKDITWLMKEILSAMTQIVTYYEEIDPSFKQRYDLDSAKVNYWANVNDPGSSNVIHSHKARQFSACYYLQAEGTGAIKFKNPANLLSDCSWGSPFTRDFHLTPLDGDLLIWPAWVPHEVMRNDSNRQRINLAFDIDIKENR